MWSVLQCPLWALVVQKKPLRGEPIEWTFLRLAIWAGPVRPRPASGQWPVAHRDRLHVFAAGGSSMPDRRQFWMIFEPFITRSPLALMLILPDPSIVMLLPLMMMVPSFFRVIEALPTWRMTSSCGDPAKPASAQAARHGAKAREHDG